MRFDYLMRASLISAATLSMTFSTQAAMVDLQPPPSAYEGQTNDGSWRSPAGPGRSVYIDATDDFDLESAGVEVNVDAPQTLTASLYVVFEGAVGGRYTTSSIEVEGAGRGWYDIPLDFTLTGGNSYLLEIVWEQAQEVTLYDFEGRGDFRSDIDPGYAVDSIAVIDGGSTMGTPNTLLAHFRLNAVDIPEPASAIMLILGLGILQRSRLFQSIHRP